MEKSVVLLASEQLSDTVVRPVKFFECDKEFTDMNGVKFSLTEAEADAAILDFKPLPLNVQHIPTIFDGLLGNVTQLYREGKDLLGKVEIPRSLHDLTKGAPLPVSSEWFQTSKKPKGMGLVIEGAVQDAIMHAAFASFAKRHDTATGQSKLQNMHDQAASSGAVCSAAGSVNMASRHEAGAIQQIHDVAVQHGAKCDPKAATYFSEPVEPAKENRTMSKTMDEIVAFFSGKPVKKEEEAVVEGGRTTDESDELKRLRTQVIQMARSNRKQDAVRDVDELIRSGHALPAERDVMILAFAQAKEDDDAAPTVLKFSAGEKTLDLSRYDAMRALYAARPKNMLAQEVLKGVLPDTELVALMARGTAVDPNAPKAATDAEIAALKGMTALGKEVLKGAGK
jgi:hypothetical protein